MAKPASMIDRLAKTRITLAALIFISIICASCGKKTLRVGVVAKDAGCVAIVVAAEGKIDAGSRLIPIVVPFDNESALETALSKGDVDAACGDAKGLLKLMAFGGANLKAVAIASRVDFKPVRIITIRSDRSSSDIEKALASIHREATGRLRENVNDAASIAAKWIGVDKSTIVTKITEYRLESGIDRAALIGLLDDLRRDGRITPTQAEALASRFVKEEGEAGKP